MHLAGVIVLASAQIYLLLLVCRMVIDLVISFARGWRPRGIAAGAAEIVFVMTDPPIKLVRRFMPPLRLGAIALDLGFIVVVFAVAFVAYLGAIMASG
ncbi:MAG: YggT family protein [Micrococcales bacterium]|nr:YggT family protein [Micrococcales bacterium]